MVLLDFDADSLLAKRTGSSPWEVDTEVPVRLNIDGVDLLGWQHGWGREEDGVPLSVIDVAWWGLVALKLAKQIGGSTLWLGMYGDRGELLFRMPETGQDVLVHSTPYRRTAQVNYDTLETAWREFAQRVREFLMREFPALKDQLYFSEWKEPGWQEWLAGREGTNLPVNLPMVVSVWNPDDKPEYEQVFSHLAGNETV